MSNSIDVFTEKSRLLRMTRLTRTLVRSLAATLAFAFAWLKLNGFPLPRLDTDLAATFFLRLALVIYYLAWLFGVLLDIQDEETVLAEAPHRGRLPVAAFGLCILITVVFGVLCWVKSYQEFMITLTVFWLVNLIAWRYLVIKLTRSAIEASRARYEAVQAYFHVERLRHLDAYLHGRWQWYRFASGLVVMCALSVVVLGDFAPQLANRLPRLSPDSLISLAILIFVVVFEGWIWGFRVKRRTGIGALDALEYSYRLVRTS